MSMPKADTYNPPCPPTDNQVVRVSRDYSEDGYTAVYLHRGFDTEAAARRFLQALLNLIEDMMGGLP